MTVWQRKIPYCTVFYTDLVCLRTIFLKLGDEDKQNEIKTEMLISSTVLKYNYMSSNIYIEHFNFC